MNLRAPAASIRRRRAVIGPALLAVAALAVACAPATGDGRTRSSTELGLRAAPVPVAPTVPSTTAAPPSTTPTTAPRTTVPPSTVPPTTAPASHIASTPRLGLGGCALFPNDNVFHASVGSLPVRGDSAATIAASGATMPLFVGFGSSVREGSRRGRPVNVVDARTTPTTDLLVGLDYASRSEPNGVPWPVGAKFEGWPGLAWDRHYVVVDSSSCRSWEAINVQSPIENLLGALTGRWYADKVVTVDLTTNTPRSGGTVTASGFSILAGLVRYDEVATGRIDHVLTFNLPTASTAPAVWPAQSTDGTNPAPAAPRMGTWYRLRSNVSLAGLGPQARVVAAALRDHGALLADSTTGTRAAVPGEPDLRWDDTDLNGLTRFTLADFEVVDPTSMKVSNGSFRIR